MSKIGRFDTDSAALRTRIASHERYSSGDMTGWALGHLGAGRGDVVLDLGAGTGQQTLRLAPDVARVVAVDASPESLSLIASAAPSNVTTITGRFDELARRDCPTRFTRAISAYALYYADDPRLVLGRIHELLEPGGVLFLCGPSYDNNAEIRRFHHALSDAPAPGPTPASTFMEDTAPAICAELFTSVERDAFVNEMRFDSAPALVEYWSSYNLYDPALEDRFRAAADEHFAREDVFVTAKRVVGVRAVR